MAMKLDPIGRFCSSTAWTTINLRPWKAACLAVAVTVPSTLQRVIRPPNRRFRRSRCPPERRTDRARALPRDFPPGRPDRCGAPRPYPPQLPPDRTAVVDGRRAEREQGLAFQPLVLAFANHRSDHLAEVHPRRSTTETW